MGTCVRSDHDSRAAPQTASPVYGTKNFSSVRRRNCIEQLWPCPEYVLENVNLLSQAQTWPGICGRLGGLVAADPSDETPHTHTFVKGQCAFRGSPSVNENHSYKENPVL